MYLVRGRADRLILTQTLKRILLIKLGKTLP